MSDIDRIANQVEALDAELAQVKAKLEGLLSAHKILTEVLMNLVAERNG